MGLHMVDQKKLEILEDALAAKFAASIKHSDNGHRLRVKGDDFPMKPNNPFQRDRVRVEAEMAEDIFSFFMPPRWKIIIKSGEWLSGRSASRRTLTEKFDRATPFEDQKALILDKISHLAASEQINILTKSNRSEEAVVAFLEKDFEL